MKTSVKRFLVVLMVMVALLFSSPTQVVNAGIPNEDQAKELVYGQWAVYQSSWCKYVFDDNNIIIKQVNEFDPYGKSVIKVSMKSNQGVWNPRTTLVVQYNSSNDKYELKIYKSNPRGDRTETTDEDYNKKFIKVYWDLDKDF